MVVVITFTITLHKNIHILYSPLNDINYFKVLIYGHIFATHVCVKHNKKKQKHHKLYISFCVNLIAFLSLLLDSSPRLIYEIPKKKKQNTKSTATRRR